jgi:hypothetical protein
MNMNSKRSGTMGELREVKQCMSLRRKFLDNEKVKQCMSLRRKFLDNEKQ